MEWDNVPLCPPFAGIIRSRFCGYNLSPKYFRHPIAKNHCKLKIDFSDYKKRNRKYLKKFTKKEINQHYKTLIHKQNEAL
jgi:hypothetical protein